jgi:hypothetical protein
MPIANNNKTILYGGIGLAVLVVIIIVCMMMKKKEKYLGAAAFGTAPLQNGGLMLESDVNGNLSTSATLPIGSIIMWSGTQSSIPVGWNLCDGTNGTPNMTGLFTMGASSDTNVGTVTGANAVQLIPENVPLWMTCNTDVCSTNIKAPVTSGAGYVYSFTDYNQLVPRIPAGDHPAQFNSAYQNIYTYDSSGNVNKVTGGAVTGSAFSTVPRNIAVYYIMKMM